ncbi:uncharacterized protein BJ171DRAFT_578568 [Polychytrium aggregatum]|uniref:uncharacterized protein n=1 Tax=Polychytrium aggregatum TaxID=110093 RepID=UPI0022FF31F5|nr:uncharacterized protein BJ171DRAFT_578568 [Polychytrium aggregatum]KAI9207448.1 hypothetical protein BJ171DRAFT_578568 [Polychytrium aggregatum]
MTDASQDPSSSLRRRSSLWKASPSPSLHSTSSASSSSHNFLKRAHNLLWALKRPSSNSLHSQSKSPLRNLRQPSNLASVESLVPPPSPSPPASPKSSKSFAKNTWLKPPPSPSVSPEQPSPPSSRRYPSLSIHIRNKNTSPTSSPSPLASPTSPNSASSPRILVPFQSFFKSSGSPSTSKGPQLPIPRLRPPRPVTKRASSMVIKRTDSKLPRPQASSANAGQTSFQHALKSAADFAGPRAPELSNTVSQRSSILVGDSLKAFYSEVMRLDADDVDLDELEAVLEKYEAR